MFNHHTCMTHLGYRIGLLLFAALLTGCAAAPKTLNFTLPAEQKRHIAVFFDGTANNEKTDTNVKRLHSILTLQPNRKDIAAFYIEGVGAGGKVIGMGMGWGVEHRIFLAYDMLVKTYRPGDEIYLFGFSRGAYTARILAALLNSAGIPVVGTTTDKERNKLIQEIYGAYKGDISAAERTRRVNAIYNSNNIVKVHRPINIKMVGLWDTVEAFGWPDFEENVDIPNKRYGDQICNIDHLSHAVSLDDDRARIFTPILASRSHLASQCSVPLQSCNTNLDEVLDPQEQQHCAAIRSIITSKVKEMYFSGAHADLGGGYDDSRLSGVSLNWMIQQIQTFAHGLLPENAGVPQDILGQSHDPESGLMGILYRQQSRDLSRYLQDSYYLDNKLPIHASVIERLSKIKPKKHEYPWLRNPAFSQCFSENDTGYVFTPGNAGCHLTVM